MIAIISTILGILSGGFPSILKLLERRQDYKYEIELTKLKIEAATRGLKIQAEAEMARADADEGKSLRDHDSDIPSNEFIDTLRASIRPVLTYLFFFLFAGIKITAATLMFEQGANTVEVLGAIWDVYTIAIFGSIMGFWFGSRTMMHFSNMYIRNPELFNINKRVVKKKGD